MNEYLDIATEEKPSGNEYLDLAKQEVTSQSDLAQSAFVAADSMPDDKAQKMKLADEMNVPVDFVERNYDTFFKKSEQAKLDSKFAEITSKSPKTAEFLKDPNNLAVAKDDLDNIVAFESEAEKHNGWSQAYNSFNSGLTRNAEQRFAGLSMHSTPPSPPAATTQTPPPPSPTTCSRKTKAAAASSSSRCQAGVRRRREAAAESPRVCEEKPPWGCVWV